MAGYLWSDLMPTVGSHLIWTTYGTWLPGDRRGHWSPLYDFYGHLLVQGGKLNPGDLVTRDLAQERMKEPAKVLSEAEMTVVSETLGTLVRRPDSDNQDPNIPW